MHRVGLAPYVETAKSSSWTRFDLLSGDSPTFLLYNSDFLQIQLLPETPARLPIAPLLRNQITFRVLVSSQDLGIGVAQIIPLLSCALVTKFGNPASSHKIFFSEYTIDKENWSNRPDPNSPKVEFIFRQNAGIKQAGLYCIKLSVNGQLKDTHCLGGDPGIELFDLPPAIYSQAQTGCDVCPELADHPELNRNFASKLAIVNGLAQYDQEDGSLLCRLDARIYEYLQ